MAHLLAGHADEALTLARSCIRDRPGFLLYNLIAMARPPSAGTPMWPGLSWSVRYSSTRP
jgi:hypothetical protein